MPSDAESEVVVYVTGSRLEYDGELLEERTMERRLRELLGRSRRGMWSFVPCGDETMLAITDGPLFALQQLDKVRHYGATFTESFGPRPTSPPLPD